jgi:hypothetical protein
MSCPTMKLSSPNSASAGPEMPIPLPGTAVAAEPPGFGSWGGSGVPGADVDEGGRSVENAFEMPRGGSAADSSSSALVDATVGGAAASVGDGAAST